MAVRTSMANLIALTRQKIGDVAAPQDFQDQDIQDALDANRDEVRYELLTAMPDIQPGQNGSTTAQFVWASYQSDYQFWETDVVIQGINTGTGLAWAVLTPVTFEYIPGKWTFAVTLPNIATPPAQYPPVWAVGKVYDLYAACADLLNTRIMLRSTLLFDFTADGRQMRLGQILDRWEKQAAIYRAMGWIRTLEMHRSDVAPDRTMAGHVNPYGSDLLPSALGDGVTRGSGGY